MLAILLLKNCNLHRGYRRYPWLQRRRHRTVI